MASTAVGSFVRGVWGFLGVLFALFFASSRALSVRHTPADGPGVVSDLHVRDGDDQEDDSDNDNGQNKGGHSPSNSHKSPKTAQDDASNGGGDNSKDSGGDQSGNASHSGSGGSNSGGGSGATSSDGSGGNGQAGGGGKKGGDSNNNTNSGSPSSSSTMPSMCSPPFCVDNTDPRLRYSVGWEITSKTSHPLHHSNVTGSTANLSFNTSSIIVFGLVPKGSHSLASYSIDGGEPVTPAVPIPDQDIVQPLFTNMHLSHDQVHSLTIIVGNVSDPTSTMSTPYFLTDIMLPFDSTHSTGSSKDTSKQPESISSSKMERDMIIIGSVLGSVIFFLLLGVVLFFILRWRQRRKSQQRQWRRKFDTVSSSVAPTMTNTASIMLNRGPTPSFQYESVDKRSSWAISEPPTAYPPARTPPPASALLDENMRSQRSSRASWMGTDVRY